MGISGPLDPLANIRFIFLAQWIRNSEVLAWDISSYFTHVILPRQSSKGCSLVELELVCLLCPGQLRAVRFFFADFVYFLANPNIMVKGRQL